MIGALPLLIMIWLHLETTSRVTLYFLIVWRIVALDGNAGGWFRFPQSLRQTSIGQVGKTKSIV